VSLLFVKLVLDNSTSSYNSDQTASLVEVVDIVAKNKMLACFRSRFSYIVVGGG